MLWRATARARQAEAKTNLTRRRENRTEVGLPPAIAAQAGLPFLPLQTIFFLHEYGLYLFLNKSGLPIQEIKLFST